MGQVLSDLELVCCKYDNADMLMLNHLRADSSGSAAPSKDFFQHFDLGKQLGKGSQGLVYSCIDKGTGAIRAVKVIHRNSSSAWATYQREVDLCRGFECRNLIQVLEDFTDASSTAWYIVMEKFQGHLRKGQKWVSTTKGIKACDFGDPPFQNIARQTLLGIDYVHQHSIVHRDVKAHNLLIDRLDITDPRCRVILSDLGLAKKLSAHDFLCTQVGTRKYWAPEIYEKRYSHSVDIFAVGVLIFLTAFGKYPFQSEADTCNCDALLAKERQEVEDVLSNEAWAFVSRCLEKQPICRPSAAELLKYSWLQTEAVPVPPCDAGDASAAATALRRVESSDSAASQSSEYLRHEVEKSPTRPTSSAGDETGSLVAQAEVWSLVTGLRPPCRI